MEKGLSAAPLWRPANRSLRGHRPFLHTGCREEPNLCTRYKVLKICLQPPEFGYESYIYQHERPIFDSYTPTPIGTTALPSPALKCSLFSSTTLQTNSTEFISQHCVRTHCGRSVNERFHAGGQTGPEPMTDPSPTSESVAVPLQQHLRRFQLGREKSRIQGGKSN